MAKARTERKRAVCAVACGAAALALGGLLIPAAAQAEETVCRGALGAVTVDNLLVPQGANCALTGTRVQGTIKVQRNAALNAAAVRVIGNVQGENARNVVVRGGSRVGGSVQVVQGQAATVRDSVVTPGHSLRPQQGGVEGDQQHRRREHSGVPKHRRGADLLQPRERQPAVQGERASAHGRRQRRARQQGGPVRAPLG